MKTDKEILDEFGRILIDNVYDYQIHSLLQYLNDEVTNTSNESIQTFKSFFRSLSDDQQKKIKLYVLYLTQHLLFSTLGLFEEHKEFKLVYEENGTQINLEKISEMLKAEIISEYGWIDRFSKYADQIPDEILMRTKQKIELDKSGI